MPGLIFTKQWSGLDDGSLLRGIDLRNLQQDLSGVLTTDDLSDHGTLVFWQNDVVSWENEAIYI